MDNVPMTRRTFAGALAGGCLVNATAESTPERTRVETVRGRVDPKQLGTTLMHEHVLVDFIGAANVNPSRYNADEVFRLALPRLMDLSKRGCRTLVECTPEYLGRDPVLLKRLSEASGLHIITNTGWYGAANDKHVPQLAYAEPADAIAERWIGEYRQGIGKTGIRPGFMKLGVDPGPLSEIDRKLMIAGGLCHQATGLRLHVHTGNGLAAMGVLEELSRLRVPASAYVWVHAQNEKDRKVHIEAAKAGALIELDGIGERHMEAHLAAVTDMIEAGYLDQLLISQDSGWYRVGEPGGGQFNGYTFLFDTFLPALRGRGISEPQIRRLLMDNPARALTFQTKSTPAAKQ